MAYVVTDLTLMGSGNACLACLDEEQLLCVRPLFHPVSYQQITWYGQNGISQGTRLDLTLSKKASSNPHTEDAICTEIKHLGQLNDRGIQQLLKASCCSTIGDGFGTTPATGEKLFRHDCELPTRSIITLEISPGNISVNQDSFNPGRIKATITDSNGFTLSWLPVTDLRYTSVSDDAFIVLRNSVRQASCVYLRLGLGRRYALQQQDGYWLQINGLYIY